ncbi:MAG: glycosyl transferase family 1 [Crocinitomicaceae bacterium]|nr:glycosyl transferase family 1 [Crocinitomicaceae bacterium]
MKKVLIITYYWPPAGGGGVQRWLRFSKYLPMFGWQPVIYTPENPDYPILDETLLKNVRNDITVIKAPIWEPYRALRKITSNNEESISAGFIRKEKREKLSARLINWVRGNLIIPDARRFWIRPSVKMLLEYLKSSPVDAIVSTGPPHSMHLIAEKVSQATGIPWLADFRDPWVNMDNADKFKMSRLAKSRHEQLEKKVLKKAHRVVTVSWHLSAQYEKIRGDRVGVITNGFDHEDFEGLKKQQRDKFTVGHYGTFGDDRNPPELWKALDDLCGENEEFRNALSIELIGPTDASVLESVNRYAFAASMVYHKYLKHTEVLKHMKNADVLLVILNQNGNEEGRVTGKIFEYIATGNSVLGLGSPTSDCAKVINDSRAGAMVAFNDRNSVKEFLLKAFANRKKTKSDYHADAMKYSRKELSASMARILDEMTTS